MALDFEVTKIRKWAADGDRIDPDDASLTPSLVRANGWPASFSSSGGDAPRREVLNQIISEITATQRELLQKGILEHNDTIEYQQYAIVQVNGLLYYRNAAGSGAFVAADWTQIVGTRSAPTAPRNNAVSLSRNDATQTWDVPSSDGGEDITGYTWERATNSSFTQSRVTGTVAADVRSVSHTGLTYGTTYYFRVYATNSEGDSPNSNVVNVLPVSTVPDAPTSLMSSSHTDTTVALNWTAPSEDGGSSITGYTVQWKSGGQAYDSARQRAVTGTSTTITGLSANTSYDFQVLANNSEGASNASNEITVMTDAASAFDGVDLTRNRQYTNEVIGSTSSYTASDLEIEYSGLSASLVPTGMSASLRDAGGFAQLVLNGTPTDSVGTQGVISVRRTGHNEFPISVAWQIVA